MTAEDKMSRSLVVLIGSVVAFVLAMIVLIALLVHSAMAQHVHPDETITDPHVAKFYDEWRRPPERIISCCNREDCYGAKIRRTPNGLEYFHKWTGTWAGLPASVVEANQKDPQDSPNTENHVCANKYDPRTVYCATLGAGI